MLIIVLSLNDQKPMNSILTHLLDYKQRQLTEDSIIRTPTETTTLIQKIKIKQVIRFQLSSVILAR